MHSKEPKIAILYATFPQPTETFVRRELKSMLDAGTRLVPFSIWRGGGEFHGVDVQCFQLRELWSLIWKLPLWMVRRPQAFVEILNELWSRKVPSWQNWQETFLGLGFGLVRASRMKREGFCLCHAVWATMPASAALALKKLVDIEYSMGGHAYDVFRSRGDWLLASKLRHAAFVRTSSASAQARLRDLGVGQEKLKLIYRGLSKWHESVAQGSLGSPLSILSVGRLVEKKGYFEQLAIYRALLEAGITFQAKIVGGGPMRDRLEAERDRLGLGDQVLFLGSLPEAEAFALYPQSDLFFFTGKVALNGDRDGLPNVIPEAMSAGVVVITSPTGGAAEALDEGETGFVRDPRKPAEWVELIESLLRLPDEVIRLRASTAKAARRLFDVTRTASELRGCLLHASKRCAKNPK
jgi:colanic acid/amylovoran biosynthesis glycosyltransferase